jgi:cytochrome P450
MDPALAWAEAMKFANRPNPYPFYEELRRTPVAKVSDKTYVVTGYPEVLALVHDPRISVDVSRSPSGFFGEKLVQLDPAEAAQNRNWSMLVTDPPEHDVMRRQFMRHFGPPHTPDLIPSMEGFVVDKANELLDAAAKRAKDSGSHRMDVVEDFSYPIPVSVIFRVMGAPIEDEPKFHGWVTDFMQAADVGPERMSPEGQAAIAKANQSSAELAAWLDDLVEKLIREPGPGLLSAALHDDGPDGPVSARVAKANALLLMIAGHDTTVNTITNAVMTLLRNPGSWDLLRDNRDLVPRAVEEVQRLQGAVQFAVNRWAMTDIEVGGTRIPEGSAVFLVLAAANRDPRRFPEPDRFDPMRQDNEHLGFGSGIHTCFGGPLARLEINLALEVFLRRVKSPRLVVDPPPYRHNQVFRGPRHLWVDFAEITD